MITKISRIVIILLLAIIVFVPFTHALSDQQISSTFIQLYQQHHDWDITQWNALFDEFEATNVTELIVQYGVYNNFAHFPTNDFNTSNTPPLETILAIAEQRGVHVLVGLNFDEQYWDVIGRDNTLLTQYLNDMHAKSLLVASQVYEIAQNYQSFEGWYIPQEIEGYVWTLYNQLDFYISFLHNLSNDLYVLTPNLKIAMSTYIYSPPETNVLYDIVNRLLANSYVTDIYFQDGIGTGWVPQDAIVDYLIQLKIAASQNDCRFHVIIELFDVGFIAASIDRVVWQIESASQVQPSSISSFATPHYMSQFGNLGSEQLLNDYLTWLSTFEPNSNPASDPVLAIASVDAITYFTFGGKGNNKHISTQIHVVDPYTNSQLAKAAVQVSFVDAFAKVVYSGTIITNENGDAVFSINNLKNGSYTTWINGITADGYEWDGLSPTNQFVK